MATLAKEVKNIVAFAHSQEDRMAYDREFKWLTCSVCKEKTPPVRYMPHYEMCIACVNYPANRTLVDFRDTQLNELWAKRGTNPIQADGSFQERV